MAHFWLRVIMSNGRQTTMPMPSARCPITQKSPARSHKTNIPKRSCRAERRLIKSAASPCSPTAFKPVGCLASDVGARQLHSARAELLKQAGHEKRRIGPIANQCSFKKREGFQPRLPGNLWTYSKRGPSDQATLPSPLCPGQNCFGALRRSPPAIVA